MRCYEKGLWGTDSADFHRYLLDKSVSSVELVRAMP
jgi:hypothetical protein